MNPPDSPFVGQWTPVLLTVTVVVLAALVNRFAEERRASLRQLTWLFLVYALSSLVRWGLKSYGLVGAVTARTVSEFAALYAWATAFAVLLFQLVLPALRIRIASIVSDLATAGLHLAATIYGARRAGFDPESILTTSAVVTGILALSLQATLGNVIGGLALQLDDSVRPGDWIQLENGRQGRVRQIRWRHTVLETRDWGTLLVPNSNLLSAQILILGKREGEARQHRYWVHFNVDFRFSPSDVIRAVESALRDGPIEGVASTPPPNCVCLDFAKEHRDSYALYAVRYWLTDLSRDDPTSSLVRERIFAALKRAAIPLAVPGAHVWVEKDSAGRRARRVAREQVLRVEAIRTVEFLKLLHDDEIEDLAAHLKPAPFAAGETITRQGAVAHWLYVFTEGEVEIRVRVADEDRTVSEISAPGFFGERGLITGEPRAATVVAKTDLECYRLDKNAFQRVLGKRPEIAAEISELFAKRHVELEASQEGLDGGGRERRIVEKKTEFLGAIRSFFAMGNETLPPP